MPAEIEIPFYFSMKGLASENPAFLSKQLSSRGAACRHGKGREAPRRGGKILAAVAIAPVPSVCRQKNESPAGKFVFAEPPRLRRRVQAPHFTGFCAAWRLRARGPRLRRLPQALPVRAPALLRPKGRSLRIEARMKIRRGRLPKRRRRLRRSRRIHRLSIRARSTPVFQGGRQIPRPPRRQIQALSPVRPRFHPLKARPRARLVN